MEQYALDEYTPYEGDRYAHSAVEKQRETINKLEEYSKTFNEEDPLSDSEIKEDEILRSQ